MVTPPVSRNPTMRNFFYNSGNKGKKNAAHTKLENEASGSDLSTRRERSLLNPATNVNDIPAIECGVTLTDAEEYFMKHKNRGKAIVLNHESFDKEDRRNGTDEDVDKLREVLGKLRFEVQVYTDLEYIDILKLLKELSEQDYSDCDCIMFFVLTHGNTRSEISAKDVYYPVEQIWEKFTADNCISLAGKPKLFFVNACQGARKDIGFDSYLDRGSWFIQCFCEALEKHYKTKDLLKILMITTRKVALDYKTQAVPSITSMLLRDIYFHE